MNELKVGSKYIGGVHPVFVIAEAGINHNGYVHIAKSIVDSAVQCGVDAIKFQKRDLSALYTQTLLNDPLKGEQGLQYMVPILRECELTIDALIEIKQYCDSKGVLFLCTPWDIPSAKFLKKLNIPLYKVASGDMTNFELLNFLIQTETPLILSTGMSEMEEVDKTVTFLKEKKACFALLHCNSTYPTPFHNINLRMINVLKERYDVPVGYSGHELGIAVSTAAVAMGACIVERHITLDRTMKGPDHAASLEPTGFKKMVRDIRNLELAMGSGKKWISRGEFANRETLGKSLYAKQTIRKGVRITATMLTVKSPYKGLSGQYFYEMIGMKAIRTIKKDEPLTENDVLLSINEKAEFPINKKIGFVVRVNDLRSIYDERLNALEFHFSDGDVKKGSWKATSKKKFSQELVIHCPEYWGDTVLDFCSFDPATRTESIEVLKKTIALAKKMKPSFLGSKGKPIKIIVHPGGISQYEIQNNKERMYSLLSDAMNVCKEPGIELLLENMPPLPWYFGGQWYHSIFIDSNEIAQFCRKNKYKMCFDISHAQLYCNWARKAMLEYIENIIPYIKHIHIADAAGWDGEGLQIGEGIVAFEKMLPILEPLDLIYTIEIWQGHKHNGLGFKMALKRLTKLWNGQ